MAFVMKCVEEGCIYVAVSHSDYGAHSRQVHGRFACRMLGCLCTYREKRSAEEHYESKHLGMRVWCSACSMDVGVDRSKFHQHLKKVQCGGKIDKRYPVDDSSCDSGDLPDAGDPAANAPDSATTASSSRATFVIDRPASVTLRLSASITESDSSSGEDHELEDDSDIADGIVTPNLSSVTTSLDNTRSSPATISDDSDSPDGESVSGIIDDPVVTSVHPSSLNAVGSNYPTQNASGFMVVNKATQTEPSLVLPLSLYNVSIQRRRASGTLFLSY